MILVAWLWFRDRISGSTVAGLALCLAGGAALLGDSLQVDRSRLVGDAYGLATGVFFGLYFHAVRAGRATHGAARLTFQSSAVTAAVLFVIAVALEPRILPQTTQGWLAVLALGMLTHAAGQGLLSVALGTLPTIFLLARHLPRGGDRRRLRLGGAGRGPDPHPGRRRGVHHARHLGGAAAMRHLAALLLLVAVVLTTRAGAARAEGATVETLEQAICRLIETGARGITCPSISSRG